MSIEHLSDFFMWSTIVSFGLLLIMTLLIMCMRDIAVRIHTKIFGIEEHDVRLAIYYYLAVFKLLSIVLFLIPFLALQILQ